MRPVFELKLPWEEVGITFIGDPHTFKTEAMTEEQRKDLVAAKERGDLIVIWGDVHEWIFPSDRKRYNSAKHNHEVNAIINHDVKKLYNFYEPFVDNIVLMKAGNHETSVIKFHHVDPLALLIDRLNQAKTNGAINYGGYTCWLIVKFEKKSVATGKRTNGVNTKFWLHHGAGGSAPVTRGAIDRARIADTIEGADVFVIGHKHQSMHTVFKREMVDDYGNVKRKDRDFLIIPGYSGWEQDAPTEDGYIRDWAAERFYGLESSGCKRVVLTPFFPHNNGVGGVDVCRRIETVSR